jgi:SAM-dependent methyltransferase
MGIELSLLSLLGYQTCGMDSNDDALHYANRVRAFLSSRVEIEKGDAFRMSYGDETFDLVYSQGFLEHFSDREVVRLVAEQIRVLRTGGYLLVDVPNKYSAYALYKLCFRLTGGWVFGFERQFSPRQIRAFVATASPRMAFVERYGWSFLGYPVRTPLDFLFMAPLLALREAMRLVNRGQDSVVVILRKS